MLGRRTVLAGRYELTNPLGRGGMGQVWEAADTRLDRRVAVKLLNEQSLAGEASDLVRRFAREAAITAGLRHPGVPVVYDVGTFEDCLYLVLELVEGSTIADLIAEQGPLPVAWATGIAAQIAAVLAVAHEHSYVHRDIKPQNVMVAPDGTVKVLDFGVAAVLDQVGISRITKSGEAIGTPAYMAPEQLHSLPATPRTDIYSLGCVLYEMLAGGPVFRADSPAGLMAKHLQQAPPPLTRSDLHPDLDHLLRRMLDKDPARRPDARETHARLLPYVSGTGRLGDLDPGGGLHLYSQALVRLAEPQPAPPPVVSMPSLPAARRTAGWKVRHSLWILPTLFFGVAAWVSFAYFALRHRRAKYLFVAFAYLAAAAVGFALIGTSPENSDSLGGTLGMVMWLCLWAGGFLHAVWINATVHLRPDEGR